MYEPIHHSKTKAYLGDGAYVDWDGCGLVLTTEDGVSVTNRVVLEPDVYEALRRYVEQLQVPAPRSDMDSGLCCMARHAQAVAPWTCDCPCHTREEG